MAQPVPPCRLTPEGKFIFNGLDRLIPAFNGIADGRYSPAGRGMAGETGAGMGPHLLRVIRLTVVLDLSTLVFSDAGCRLTRLQRKELQARLVGPGARRAQRSATRQTQWLETAIFSSRIFLFAKALMTQAILHLMPLLKQGWAPNRRAANKSLRKTYGCR